MKNPTPRARPRLWVVVPALATIAGLGLALTPAARASDELPARFQRFDQVIGDPALLLRAVASRDFELDRAQRFHLLHLVGLLHPGSQESRDAFVLAAKTFKPLWYTTRYETPRPEWQEAAPLALFYWLDALATESFPKREADMLLLRMPVAFYRSYEEFASGSRWLSKYPLLMEKDNGLVRSIELRDGTRTADAGS